MEWDKYELKETDEVGYGFISEGPKGHIKKVIKFRRLNHLGEHVYNLAFGDLNEKEDSFDDRIVSNNGDELKILYTVASAVLEFFKSRPNAYIVIKGSTSSRTRLYQMRIAGFLSEILHYVEIMGEYRGGWSPFQRGVNYERFLVYKKKE